MAKIWIVTNGQNNTTVLGLFSTRAGADAYRSILVERFSRGRRLQLSGKPLAEHAGAWELGVDGPDIVESTVDSPAEELPGAWSVRVDECCRMIGCRFSTTTRVTRLSHIHRDGDRLECEGYGPSPQEALDRARKGMQHYLIRPGHPWR